MFNIIKTLDWTKSTFIQTKNSLNYTLYCVDKRRVLFFLIPLNLALPYDRVREIIELDPVSKNDRYFTNKNSFV